MRALCSSLSMYAIKTGHILLGPMRDLRLVVRVGYGLATGWDKGRGYAAG